jgi:tellurite resistance protein TerC
MVQDASTEAAPAPLHVSPWAWAVFGGIVLVSLAVDLTVHRAVPRQTRAHAVGWSIAWIVLALSFGMWVAAQFGRDAAEDYLTAYVVEKSLSVDNLFVFLVVFERLNISQRDQHRVLFWGILGALLTRGVFIASGIAILRAWHGIVYVLGALLLLTGVRTVMMREEEAGEGRILAFLRKHLPITSRTDTHRFVVVEEGVRLATPLLLALLVIELTDVMFAVDSIPAVFAVSEEPFIVYSSNVFAVLGLRALYVVLASLLSDLKYLRYGIGAILVFAGAKMLGSSVVHVPHAVWLVVILVCLVASIVPSLVARRRTLRGPRPGPG